MYPVETLSFKPAESQINLPHVARTSLSLVRRIISG